MTLKIGACQPSQRIGSNLTGSATCGRPRKRGTGRRPRTCKNEGVFLVSVTKNKRFLLEEVGLRRIKVWIGAALQKGERVWERSCLSRSNNWVAKGTTLRAFQHQWVRRVMGWPRAPCSAKLCLQHNYLFRYKRYIVSGLSSIGV